MNRTRFVLAALPLALGCPQPATDKLGTNDSAGAVCDRIHGATGVVLFIVIMILNALAGSAIRKKAGRR